VTTRCNTEICPNLRSIRYLAAVRWVALTDWVGFDDVDLTGIESVATDPVDPDRLYAAITSERARGASLATDVSQFEP